jgi:hypothetical protein
MKDGKQKKILHVHVKLTPEEAKKLEDNAKACGMNRSTFIRFKTIYEQKEVQQMEWTCFFLGVLSTIFIEMAGFITIGFVLWRRDKNDDGK